MKKWLKVIFFILLLPLLLLFGFLGYMSLTDYRPENIEKIAIEGEATYQNIPDTLSVVTWNIGYCGLGKEQDFFFDGGKGVRPNKDDFQRYVDGVMKTIHGFAGSDFILLQEVDRDAKRSYFQDQVSLIATQLPGYAYAFALNYRTQFIPQPVSKPYGKVVAGIMSLSAYHPTSATRYSLTPDAAWPIGLFMLKRCFLVFRYPAKNGKELVIVNQHLSAYDDGTIKQQQMNTLRKFLLNEYAHGNFVIVGGDWNQFPPDYHPELSAADGLVGLNVEKNYPEPGWSWVYDLSTTTNRKLNLPYEAGKTETVIIDYFLVSPNVAPLSINVIDLGFAYSDHQPVKARFQLQ